MSRHFLRIFLPLLLLVLAGGFISYHKDVRLEREGLVTAAREHALLAEGELGQSLAGIGRDLMVLAEQAILRQALDNPTPEQLGQLADDFRVFSRNQRVFDQIRWLDETGQERVRVNFAEPEPVVVPAEQLQNKRGRYYFDETLRLGRGQVYVSPLDLNIEHGEIEQPFKPMIRIGTPVFDSRGRSGASC